MYNTLLVSLHFTLEYSNNNKSRKTEPLPFINILDLTDTINKKNPTKQQNK